MSLNKINILKDDECNMMRIELEGQCLFEGNEWEFPKDGDLAGFLRKVGFSVTEEGYSYE